MNNRSLFLTSMLFGLFIVSGSVYASYWKTSSYHVVTYTRADNGVNYVYPPNYSGNCAYKRLAITDSLPYSHDYASRLYSTLLSAIAQKKKIRFTWKEPDVSSNCILNSLDVKWDS